MGKDDKKSVSIKGVKIWKNVFCIDVVPFAADIVLIPYNY